MSDFEAFPKIARLNREIVVTEKIDGTNACVRVDPLNTPDGTALKPPMDRWWTQAVIEDRRFAVSAGSRSRWISPRDDNFGFAAWVYNNATMLSMLGEGVHFGEWWGKGIQRGYGVPVKAFSLFNVGRWIGPDNAWSDLGKEYPPQICGVVPVLYRGAFSQADIELTIERLRRDGSRAAPGFMRPEGVIVYHTAARTLFKVTLERDNEPKSKE